MPGMMHLAARCASVAIVVVTGFTSQSLTAATYTTTSETLSDGLMQFKTVSELSDGRFFEVNGLRVDPSKYALSVVYAPDLLSRVDVSPVQIPRAIETKRQQSGRHPLPTLSAVAEVVAPEAAINAGFRQGSWSYIVPAGLLVVDGTLVQPLNRKSRSQTGILCIEGQAVRLLPVSELSELECRDAVQAGPFIIDPGGRIGISDEERTKLPAYRRSFICQQEDGGVVIATTTEVHLRDLAEMLLEPEQQCERALNLSGDIEAGLLVRGAQSRQYRVFGEAEAAISSALVVNRWTARETVALASDDPFVAEGKEFFADTIEAAMDIVSDDALSDREKDKQLLEIAFATFAVDDIASFVLATARKQFSEPELDEFKQLYARWLIRKYIARLYNSHENVESFEEVGARKADGEQLTLETEATVKEPNATKVRISWDLVKADRFQITDVRIEGLSMIATHRSDFSQIVHAEGPQGLLKRLAEGLPVLSAE